MMPIPAPDAQTLPVPTTCWVPSKPSPEQLAERQNRGKQHSGALTSRGLAQRRLSRGAVTWGERPWHCQGGGMHCPKKF